VWGYSAGVDGGFDKKLFFFISGEVDGFSDEWFYFGAVSDEFDVWFVIFLDEL
jgi:hypothetical protein